MTGNAVAGRTERSGSSAALKRMRGLLSGAAILAEAMLSGSCRSVHRGRGSEFSEVREYSGLDDARAIDWNVSARMGRPFIKVFKEERELPVLVLLDNSASMAAFEPGPSCRDAGAAAAALIAWAADSNGDRAALSVFDSGPRVAIREGRGRRHVMAILRALSDLPPPGNSTDIAGAMETAARELKRRSLVLVFSDFLSGGWVRAARSLSSRHELVLARISHRVMSSGTGRSAKEGRLPASGVFSAADPETGRRMDADFGSPSFRRDYSAWSGRVAEDFQESARLAGAKGFEIPEDGDPLKSLVAFFKMRGRGSR